MKQSKEILGKSIISISSGKDIGSVKNFVINPELRSIEFLVVQNEQWEFGIKAIPFKLVEGLGDYAVTIESETCIIDLADIPVANDLLSKNIHIKGTRVITRKGQFLGQISEFMFSQETGKILGCYVERTDGETKILPEEHVVTFGKEITVAAEESDKYLVTEESFRVAQAKQDGTETTRQAETEVAAAVEASELDELIGRIISANLYDEQGELLLAEGEEITPEVVDKVKRLGRNKALELALKAVE
ncbi:PRC-barrel domain-containing protein [Brevibacillus sp. H7]|uniref:PRC-barrel domain-containing protein n=1 Tax=Brevibacillus sp. H7 TaxID=3349138 RepID=UPI00382320E0